MPGIAVKPNIATPVITIKNIIDKYAVQAISLLEYGL